MKRPNDANRDILWARIAKKPRPQPRLVIYSYLKYDTFTALKKMQRSEQTSERVLNRRYMKEGPFLSRICEGVRSSLGGAPAHPRIKPCWVPPGRASHADVLTGSSGVPAPQTPAESSGLCGGLSVIDFTHFSTNSTFLGLVNIQFQEWKLQFFDIHSCIKKWIRGLQTSLRTAAIFPRSSSLRDVS